MRRVHLFAAALLLVPCAALGREEYASQLVKQKAWSYLYDQQHGRSIWGCAMTATFGGTTRTAIIGGADPGHPTANPFSTPACAIYDADGDGDFEFNCQIYLESLRDIGTWTEQWDCWDVDLAYCASVNTPPCYFACDANYILHMAPLTVYLTAYNSPPTASPSHTPTPAWNAAMTLRSNASDPDHGTSGLSYAWSISSHPPASTTALSNASAANANITFASERDIGNWAFGVNVVDSEGELVSFSDSFAVPNAAPSITIDGATMIDALQIIALGASPTTDPDGGTLAISWDIVSSPPTSQHAPQTGYATGATFTPITTTEHDIGTWTIRATATDNEGPAANPPGVDVKQVTVKVRNLPPRISFAGSPVVRVGTPIHVETQVLQDDDGGSLAFRWDVVQAPQSAPIAVQTAYSSASAIDIPTSRSHAGTWIFKLTATDNEGPAADPAGEVSAEYTVLVDAPPEISIAVTTAAGGASGSPATVSGGNFPVVLDASASIDPDSPCPTQPDQCHDTDGRSPSVSGAIVSYRWSVVDVPPERWGEIPLGFVDEVFGVDGSGPLLTFDSFLELGEGQFTFRLDVADAEGNVVSATQQVVVVAPNTRPNAVVSAPARYVTDAFGVLQGAIALSGASSFDLDNLFSGGVGPGIGISSYAWAVTRAPAGCAPPSLPGTSVVTLYAAGATVPAACFGFWQIALSVTDDDSPALTDTATADILIGNCAQNVCIDYPTAAFPQLVEFSDSTDVTIYYHLDAGVYAAAPLLSGLFAQLEIFHEGDPLAFWADYDPNPLAFSLGGFTVFHWNGYGLAGQRPPPGKYTVRITLLDYGFTASSYFAQEANAIQIATADPVLSPASEDLASRDAMEAGTDSLSLAYQITGAAHADRLTLRIRSGAGAEVYSRTDAISTTSGTLTWDGKVAAGTFAPAGAYKAELVAMRGSAVLGTSAPHFFAIIRTDLDVDADRDGAVDDTADESGEGTWTKSRGAIYTVNFDRDGSRVDSLGRPLPDAVDVDDSGTPGHEDLLVNGAADALDLAPMVLRGLGAPLPAGVTVVLKAAELEDVQSIHVFKRIADGETAIWGGLGSRIGQPPVPLEQDVTAFVDPASPSFAGAPTSGDVTFGIEGLFFRNTGIVNPFDGEIDLRVEFRRGGAVLYADDVHLKVAPWIMLPHTIATNNLWAADDGPLNATFLRNAAADPGYVGLEDSAQLRLVGLVPGDGNDQWVQDHVETGYYQRPGGPKTVATLRLPRFAQPPWPVSNLLGPDAAVFQLSGYLGDDADGSGYVAGSFGGNVELLPPTAAHPLGRMVFGDTMSVALRAFLEAQEVQPSVPLPTRWLMVGHVDEYVTYSDTPGVLVVADPTQAYAVMTAIPAAERGASVFFAKGARPQAGTVTASRAALDELDTGIDLSGTTWKYVRIYRDAGSGAAGQTAEITARANGYLRVGTVWDTGTKIIPGSGAANTVSAHMAQVAPSQPTWFRAPGPGDAYVLLEGTRFWADALGDGTPAAITVEEILADADLAALNTTDAVAQITAGKSALQAAAGGALTFKTVPVVFIGERPGFATARTAVAFTPGLANGQFAAGRFYFPRQFGPLNVAGTDRFEDAARTTAPSAAFVDDWDLYHRLEGEVHCGSSGVRSPMALDWWSNQP